jgi:hypothetical protein
MVGVTANRPLAARAAKKNGHHARLADEAAADP